MSAAPGGGALDDARARLREALARFEAVALAAIDAAADPKSSRARVADARTQGTFALAAVGAAYKGALKAARPSEED